MVTYFDKTACINHFLTKNCTLFTKGPGNYSQVHPEVLEAKRNPEKAFENLRLSILDGGNRYSPNCFNLTSMLHLHQLAAVWKITISASNASSLNQRML